MLVQENDILYMEAVVPFSVVLATEETPQLSIIKAAHVAHDFIAATVNTEMTKDAMFAMDVRIISTLVTRCSVKDLVYTCAKN